MNTIDETQDKSKVWESPTIVNIDIRDTHGGQAPLNTEDGTYQEESQ